MSDWRKLRKPRGALVGLHGNPMAPEAFETMTSLAGRNRAAGLVVALPAGAPSGRRGYKWDPREDVEPRASTVDELLARYGLKDGRATVCGPLRWCPTCLPA